MVAAGPFSWPASYNRKIGSESTVILEAIFSRIALFGLGLYNIFHIEGATDRWSKIKLALLCVKLYFSLSLSLAHLLPSNLISTTNFAQQYPLLTTAIIMIINQLSHFNFSPQLTKLAACCVSVCVCWRLQPRDRERTRWMIVRMSIAHLLSISVVVT